MDVLSIIVSIGIILIIGYIGQIGFQRYRIPDIIILIFIGILVGPILHLITSDVFIKYIPFIADIALIVIMFDAGLDLNFAELAKSFRKMLTMGVLSYLFTVILITVVLNILYHWYIKDSMIYAFILAAPSVTIVTSLLKKADMDEETKHIFVLESAIADIFVIVLTLSLLSYTVFDVTMILHVSKTLFSNILVGIFIGVVAGILWLELLRIVERWEFSYTLTLAITFILFVIAQYTSGSGLIAVIAFGVVLGNDDEIRTIISKNEYIKKIFPIKDWKMSGQIQMFHSEVTFFIRTFLFVAVGMLVSSNLLSINVLSLSCIMLVLIYISRFVAIKISNYKKAKNKKVVQFLAITPRGLTQAVMALYVVGIYTSLPMSLLISTVVTVIIISNIIASMYLFVKRPTTVQT